MAALVKLQSNVKKDFSTKKPAEKKEWELVPEGEYVGVLKQIDEKTSKNGNQYLSVRFEVEVGDAREKRLVFVKFMLDHPNPAVIRGATAKMQAMAKALGAKNSIEDTSELAAMVGEKCVLRVVVKEGQNGFGDYNDIGRFLKY